MEFRERWDGSVASSHYADCLHRSRGRADWLANPHLDEFIRPQGVHSSVLSALRPLTRDRYDAVRLYEYQWVAANESVDVSYGVEYKTPSALADLIGSGALLRPAIPWTRMPLMENGELTCGEQPYLTVLRPDRFEYWGAHQPVLAGGEGENRSRSYRFADPSQELCCDHFSRHLFRAGRPGSSQAMPDEFGGGYGARFVGSDSNDANRCPELDKQIATFARDSFLADVWDSCLQRILDSNGTRVRAC